MDVAVLDIALRDGASWPVAAALRARDVPFVFVTGYGDTVAPAEFKDVVLFRKPADMPRLINALVTRAEAGAAVRRLAGRPRAGAEAGPALEP